MTGTVPLRLRRQDLGTLRADRQNVAEPQARSGRERVQHDGGSLAGCDHVNAPGPMQRRDDVRVFEGALHETSGIHAGNGGAQHSREIVSKPESVWNQLTWRGSVQAESPVTTSN